METFTWYMIVAAVIAGNGITAAFIYSLMQIRKVEKQGLDASYAKWRYIIGITVPGLIVAWAGYMLTRG